MTAFADQVDLRHAVAEHIKEYTATDSFAIDLRQAEARLNQKLRMRPQVTFDTLTFASGVSALPADWLEMITVYDTSNFPMKQTGLEGVKRSSSQDRYYAVNGTSVLIYGLTGDRDIEYYAKLPTLTASQTTSNWLLQKYPEVYLYAVCAMAAVRMGNPDMVQGFNALFNGALSDADRDDKNSRWADASVRLALVTP